MNFIWIDLLYLVAAVMFITGIKGLTRPKTAVRGNIVAAIGMFIAVVVTLLNSKIVSYELIIAGILLGSLVGAVLAKKMPMTSMPQMVALLNGFGGGASLAIAVASYLVMSVGAEQNNGPLLIASQVAIVLTVLIGGVTLSGSAVALAKLQEWLPGKSIGFPGIKFFNVLLVISALYMGYGLFESPVSGGYLVLLVAIVLVLGVTLVIPIGGADMPVVIALLNAYSGIAAAAAGFIMGNTVLIISGALVGASGLILTQIMCVAMNRSLVNVLFGTIETGSGETMDADEVYGGKVKSSCPDEVAMVLETASRVVIVPGFGMAMAQAQHAVRDLADTLQSQNIEVEYAIHPVAGRMPGHMNVLLAEAEVDYDLMKTMDEANPTFDQTDVVIVIGANDVTNPMAREDKGSPIYGMPILNVDKAKTVVVVKRSLSAGFAGLPNPLFANDNTLMLFGDGKKAIQDLTAAVNKAA
ncbi:NAD(P)(+) transhydrogenase (Re/Si-specific) subunit beta [Colwellia psychrerythraea]|uniref:NAD(P) transhydrogenase subunit beta n=1 Tax=Colwellia psychrerythraea (strain 34H / ATCC BAA-681) TaxID=167879 RepID=Q47WX3_COLP3|nr:NAD(P)(+) transhydrogenase (Re/Si-specific) subunit beta [Colwellia psychrerythraea]AAZ25627.1 NAD(P) transhydrogenase, beta subunit [Colwellia psychrerythraea 34H]